MFDFLLFKQKEILYNKQDHNCTINYLVITRKKIVRHIYIYICMYVCIYIQIVFCILINKDRLYYQQNL